MDSFVCFRPNGRHIGSFKKGFEQVLNEAGVLRGSDGKKRVPCSHKHTYATTRISEGVSVFQLVANMGTSVEMIESFYGKKRMRDPKMATEVTKLGDGDRQDKATPYDLCRQRSVCKSFCPKFNNFNLPIQAHRCIRLNAAMPVEILSRWRQVRREAAFGGRMTGSGIPLGGLAWGALI